jgi:hypothetical protein
MRHAIVWYSSQPFSITSIARSGVRTWTAPSTSRQCSVTSSRTASRSRPVARDQRPAPPRRGALADERDHSTLLAGGDLHVRCSAVHGSRPAPVRPDSGVACAGPPPAPRAAPAPRNSVRSPVQARRRRARSAKATRPAYAVLHGLRTSSAPVAASCSVIEERRRRAPRRAEHPLGVGGDGEPPVTARAVVERQPRDLDRVLERHVLQQLERDAVGLVLEAAVAEAVARDVRPPSRIGCAVGSRRRPSPRRARRALAGRVDDRVVRPRRELVVAAVLGPRVAAPLGRHLEPEAGVGDDVDPRHRRRAAAIEDGHVLAAVGVEAAEAVEELEPRAGPGGAPATIGGGRRRARVARRTGAATPRPRTCGRADRDRGRAGRSGRRAPPNEQERPRSASSGPRAARTPSPAPSTSPKRGRDWLLRTAVSIAIWRSWRYDAAVLVDDHEVDGQALQAPVLVRAQQLAHLREVGDVVDAQQHDRQVARDRVGPQARLRSRPARDRARRRAEAGVGVQERRREALEVRRLLGADVEEAELDLGLGPRERLGAVEGAAVVVLVDRGRRAPRASPRPPSRTRRARPRPAEPHPRRSAKIGSSTVPTVFDSARPSRSPRPRDRPAAPDEARAVGLELRRPEVALHDGEVRRPHLGSSGERRRRVAISASYSAQVLGLDEHLREGGMRRVGGRRRQHQLGVRGERRSRARGARCSPATRAAPRRRPHRRRGRPSWSSAATRRMNSAWSSPNSRRRSATAPSGCDPRPTRRRRSARRAGTRTCRGRRGSRRRASGSRDVAPAAVAAPVAVSITA